MAFPRASPGANRWRRIEVLMQLNEFVAEHKDKAEVVFGRNHRRPLSGRHLSLRAAIGRALRRGLTRHQSVECSVDDAPPGIETFVGLGVQPPRKVQRRHENSRRQLRIRSHRGRPRPVRKAPRARARSASLVGEPDRSSPCISSRPPATGDDDMSARTQWCDARIASEKDKYGITAS